MVAGLRKPVQPTFRSPLLYYLQLRYLTVSAYVMS